MSTLYLKIDFVHQENSDRITYLYASTVRKDVYNVKMNSDVLLVTNNQRRCLLLYIQKIAFVLYQDTFPILKVPHFNLNFKNLIVAMMKAVETSAIETG